ncbi:MAG: hypothetical protein IKZ89_09920 [Bacteroidaceae bacterium]|nr:hypothetical protein [Bacteroidaceae bacterium]
MKKIITVLMAAMMIITSSYAQTSKELKQIAKEAKKEAKQFKKEGWLVAPGQLPLEEQFKTSYSMKKERDDNGLPKYIFGEAMSVGEIYDAASRNAKQLATEDLASRIQTEVTNLIETTVANEQISQDDASSLARYVNAGKSLIVQRIGRTISVVECYRTQKNGTIQVRSILAYNEKMAMEAAKAVIKKQLEEKGQDLHEQLDAIWDQYGK